MEDYEQELKHIGISDNFRDLERINPEATLKFLQINKSKSILLKCVAKKNNFPLWENFKQNFADIIISLPSPASLDLIFAESSGNSAFKQEILNFRKNLKKNSWHFKIPSGSLEINRPLIMGILNVTPDSFADGGRYLDPKKAIIHALDMVEAGVDIIDIGAESTRPGSEIVELEEEWRRIKSVFREIRKKVDLPISIDTYKAEIARRALEEGADIVNDISGLNFDRKMVEVVAEFNVPVVLMHIKGTPRDMQKNPHYENLMEEIYSFLANQIERANEFGIQQIIVDPGIGFGKRLEDNFEIIRRLKELKGLGFPILIGPSRKSFIGKTLNLPVDQRLLGTAAAVSACILNGAHIVRVHDVAEMRQVVEITRAICERKFH